MKVADEMFVRGIVDVDGLDAESAGIQLFREPFLDGGTRYFFDLVAGHAALGSVEVVHDCRVGARLRDGFLNGLLFGVSA